MVLFFTIMLLFYLLHDQLQTEPRIIIPVLLNKLVYKKFSFKLLKKQIHMIGIISHLFSHGIYFKGYC